VITAYLFFRFAWRIFMLPQAEGAGYRSTATVPLPTTHLAVAGALWCVWRFSTYPLVPEMLPFLGFWLAFFLWFAIGAIVNRADQQRPPA